MRITNSRKRRVEPEGKITVTYYMATMNSMYCERVDLLKTMILTGREEEKAKLICQGGSQEMTPKTEESRSTLFRLMELRHQKREKINS